MISKQNTHKMANRAKILFKKKLFPDVVKLIDSYDILDIDEVSISYKSLSYFFLNDNVNAIKTIDSYVYVHGKKDRVTMTYAFIYFKNASFELSFISYYQLPIDALKGVYLAQFSTLLIFRGVISVNDLLKYKHTTFKKSISTLLKNKNITKKEKSRKIFKKRFRVPMLCEISNNAHYREISEIFNFIKMKQYILMHDKLCHVLVSEFPLYELYNLGWSTIYMVIRDGLEERCKGIKMIDDILYDIRDTFIKETTYIVEDLIMSNQLKELEDVLLTISCITDHESPVYYNCEECMLSNDHQAMMFMLTVVIEKIRNFKGN